MWSLASVFFPLLLSGTVRASAPLARTGETIGGAEVVELVDHPEYHRIIVRLDDGTDLTVELVATDTPLGACTHHGFAVQPRWELRDQTHRTVEDQPPVVQELCARLAASPPQLSLAPPAGEGVPSGRDSEEEQQGIGTERFHEPDGSKAPKRRPLHAVLGALLLAIGFAGAVVWRRQATSSPGAPSAARRELLVVFVIGTAARLLLGLKGTLWSPMFGFGRLGMVLSGSEPVPRYGDGFTSTMTAITTIFGASTPTIFAANLALGAAVPPLIWFTMRVLAPERERAPLAAGLLAALLPVHVWISGTEVMHVSLVTYEVLAVAAAALFLRHAPSHWLASLGFALASALASVMAAHTRPEAIPFVVVPALLLLLRAGRAHLVGLGLGSAVVVVGVLLRFSEMAFDPSGAASAVQYGMLLEAATWLSLFVPDVGNTANATAISVLVRPSLTSPILPLLALVGLWKAPRALAGTLAVWWVVTIVPVLPKAWPLADAYRLQAASLMPVVMLAGLGLDAAVSWVRLRRPSLPTSPLVVCAALGLAVSPQLLLERPDWGTLDESRLLLRATPLLDPSSTILYDSTHRHSHAVAAWGAFAAPGTSWRPLSQYTDLEERSGPLLVWLGSACHDADLVRASAVSTAACARVRDACTLRPASVVTIPLTADIDRRFTVEAAEVGFYRLEDCTAAPGASESVSAP